MGKGYTLKLWCSHDGCREQSFYSCTNAADYKDAFRRLNGKWLCTRHSRPDELLTTDNLTVSGALYVKKLLYNGGRPQVLGLFWQKECNTGTDKCESGFIRGEGFKAFAKDFPEGTKITITAIIELPK